MTDETETQPDMDIAQLHALYVAFCVGFFQNNYVLPRATDVPEYNTKFKRLFRTFCIRAYDFDPVTADYMNPDRWEEWTWTAFQLDEELRAT
jgi:hypothetical protein